MLSKKNLLTVLGALILGALGSGVWELVFRPSGRWLGHTVLSAVSFGSTSVRDAVYREAARGFHEGSGLMLLGFFLGLIGSAPLFLLLDALLDRRRLQRDRSGTPRVSGANRQEVEAKLSQLQTEIDRLDKRMGRLLTARFVALAILAVPCLTVTFNGLKLTAANDAFTFFSQSMTICRPYMTDQDARILNSRFAQIRGRSDYMMIASKLREIAESNHAVLPEYEPF